ncbi:MAG TPA: TauD/TfdA family dioxygenase [Gaiellaceae bacterium]|jgi:gamma-butyrobetaine dioxygenase|nr:TauD/TfdA family dioxygenase [Gaiellaceae bacterium]
MDVTQLHPLWLRDNCPCPECRHESGQRLLDTRAIPDDLAIASHVVTRPRHMGSHGTSGDVVEIIFSDGHASRFDLGWLAANTGPGGPRPRRLWDASIQDSLPLAYHDDVAAGGAALGDWLRYVDELGFAILGRCPTEPGTVTRVAELFGFVRETNYGRLFDVKTVVNPTNLAYTGLGLGAHSDNPYRDPTPTLQLLHCLASSADGGENTLVDAFRVVEDLPRDDVELLATRPVRFRYTDAETDLETETTVISLDARGDVQAVRYNTRSAQPFRLPTGDVRRFYAAYQRFGRLLEEPRYRIQFKLDAGGLFIVDNLRVLHGRTGYSSSGGERHLQGCYADRDGLRSTLAVLSR